MPIVIAGIPRLMSRRDSPLHKVRLWVDYDAPRPTDEKGSYRWRSDEFLKQWDWQQGENFVIKGVAEEHNEAAWRARLDEVMRFLFSPMMHGNSRPEA